MVVKDVNSSNSIFNSKKNKVIIAAALTVLLILLVLTNPTLRDYEAFSLGKYGEKPSGIPFEIERIDFYIFSTYTPYAYGFEPGITHLGIMGRFLQISKGQYHYPWWLNLFN